MWLTFSANITSKAVSIEKLEARTNILPLSFFRLIKKSETWPGYFWQVLWDWPDVDCVWLICCSPSAACGSSAHTSWWAYPRTWQVWEPPCRVCRLETQAHKNRSISDCPGCQTTSSVGVTHQLVWEQALVTYLPSHLWRTEWVTEWKTGSIYPWCCRSRWLCSRCTGTRRPLPNERESRQTWVSEWVSSYCLYVRFFISAYWKRNQCQALSTSRHIYSTDSQGEVWKKENDHGQFKMVTR